MVLKNARRKIVYLLAATAVALALLAGPTLATPAYAGGECPGASSSNCG